MKKHIVYGVSLAAAVGVLAYASVGPKHIGPSYLYPDHFLTPGQADTLSLDDLTRLYGGKTYSQSHRNVPSKEKQQVLAEYSVTKAGEIDHFYPLCAGGSNVIANLWPQPEHAIWNGEDYGFHAKDKLEAYVCEQIKASKLDPKVAYQKITSDWVAYYQELKLSGNTNETVE